MDAILRITASASIFSIKTSLCASLRPNVLANSCRSASSAASMTPSFSLNRRALLRKACSASRNSALPITHAPFRRGTTRLSIDSLNKVSRSSFATWIVDNPSNGSGRLSGKCNWCPDGCTGTTFTPFLSACSSSRRTQSPSLTHLSSAPVLMMMIRFFAASIAP